MTLRRRVPVLVVLACAGTVLLGACGEEADLRTNRPDVTMAPPVSGDKAAPAVKKAPATVKQHQKKAPKASATRWQRVTDRGSRISFLMPSAVDPTVTSLPSPDAEQRMYLSPPGDGSLVMVAVADVPGAHSFDVDGAIRGATSQIRAQGATSVQVGRRRTLVVAGHPTAEFDLTYAEGAAQGYAIFRMVMLDERFVLAGVVSPATEVLARARRDSLRLQSRLNDGLRFG